jgi:hypothetical protein
MFAFEYLIALILIATGTTAATATIYQPLKTKWVENECFIQGDGAGKLGGGNTESNPECDQVANEHNGTTDDGKPVDNTGTYTLKFTSDTTSVNLSKEEASAANVAQIIISKTNMSLDLYNNDKAVSNLNKFIVPNTDDVTAIQKLGDNFGGSSTLKFTGTTKVGSKSYDANTSIAVSVDQSNISLVMNSHDLYRAISDTSDVKASDFINSATATDKDGNQTDVKDKVTIGNKSDVNKAIQSATTSSSNISVTLNLEYGGVKVTKYANIVLRQYCNSGNDGIICYNDIGNVDAQYLKTISNQELANQIIKNSSVISNNSAYGMDQADITYKFVDGDTDYLQNIRDNITNGGNTVNPIKFYPSFSDSIYAGLNINLVNGDDINNLDLDSIKIVPNSYSLVDGTALGTVNGCNLQNGLVATGINLENSMSNALSTAPNCQLTTSIAMQAVANTQLKVIGVVKGTQTEVDLSSKLNDVDPVCTVSNTTSESSAKCTYTVSVKDLTATSNATISLKQGANWNTFLAVADGDTSCSSSPSATSGLNTSDGKLSWYTRNCSGGTYSKKVTEFVPEFSTENYCKTSKFGSISGYTCKLNQNGKYSPVKDTVSMSNIFTTNATIHSYRTDGVGSEAPFLAKQKCINSVNKLYKLDGAGYILVTDYSQCAAFVNYNVTYTVFNNAYRLFTTYEDCIAQESSYNTKGYICEKVQVSKYNGGTSRLLWQSRLLN